MLDCGNSKTNKDWILLSGDFQAEIDRYANRTMGCCQRHDVTCTECSGTERRGGDLSVGMFVVLAEGQGSDSLEAMWECLHACS